MNTKIEIILSTKQRRAISRVMVADRAGRGYSSTDGEIRDRFLRRALALAREAAGGRRACDRCKLYDRSPGSRHCKYCAMLA